MPGERNLDDQWQQTGENSMTRDRRTGPCLLRTTCQPPLRFMPSLHSCNRKAVSTEALFLINNMLEQQGEKSEVLSNVLSSGQCSQIIVKPEEINDFCSICASCFTYFRYILPKPLLLLFPRDLIPLSILAPFSFSKSLMQHRNRNAGHLSQPERVTLQNLPSTAAPAAP